MSKQAVAIVRIDPGTVRSALASAGGEDQRVGANGETFRIGALDDATLVHLGIAIGSEPGELAARIRGLMGDLLEAHAEARGVPLYPSSYALEARTWGAAIEELGEAADWVKVQADAPEGMADTLRAFGLDASQVAEMGRHLQGAGGEDMFAAAMQAAREMSESGAFQDLAERMRGAGLGADPSALAGVGLDAMGLDLEALTKEAQRVLAENPDLEEQLRRALEGGDGEDE